MYISGQFLIEFKLCFMMPLKVYGLEKNYIKMDAVGGTAGIFHLIYQFFSRIQQARSFEEEFGLYLLQLQVHLSRCATVSKTIHDPNGAADMLAISAIDGPKKAPDNQESTVAEILSAIQNRLRKAQQDATEMEAVFLRIGTPRTEAADGVETMRFRITGCLNKRKVQAAKTVEGIKWAFYKKDKHDKFIADISALIKHLERKVNANKEGLSLSNSSIIYIARAHTSAI
ncbi:hypothetical protein GGI42DRAFT_328805 [Trichoderma sp. SZMC 28013]